MEPGKTSFFQALGVPTKIARGTIEITTDLKLVEASHKVGPSEATLLNMLNISPFTYGMSIAQVYDQGNTFPADVLDIGEEQLLAAFSSAINTIAAVSLAINFPTLPSVIHSLVNTYKKVLAVAIETEVSWPEIEDLKDRIANPDAYAAAAPTAAAAGGAAAAETKAEEKKDESEEEGSDEEGFGGLLYVPLCLRVSSALLTRSTATKCSNIMAVLLDLQSGFQSGKGLIDLYPPLRRLFAVQLSTLCLMVTSSRIRCFMNAGARHSHRTTFESEVSNLFPLLLYQHLSVSMIIQMIKELFNPEFY